MGVYDRDYYREQRPSFSVHAPRTVIGVLILINVAIYVADAFTPVSRVFPGTGEVAGRWLSDHMLVQVDALTKPWLWWKFLTYGFAHSPISISHVLFNMLTLFFLGRDVEARYGSKEFLRLYMTMLVVAGVGWAIVGKLTDPEALRGAYGASGAVTGVVVLYALNFPRRMLLLFFVLPVPAWLVGALVVVIDAFGALNPGESNIGHTAHLSGAAFAILYHHFRWNLGRLVPGPSFWRRFTSRRRLRVHTPEDEPPDFTAEVDRILEKIHQSGEASLTRKERSLLERAAREYQRRRQG